MLNQLLRTRNIARHRAGNPFSLVQLLGVCLALAAIAAPSKAQSLSVGANFTSITRSQTAPLAGIFEPPDTMGAAGPNHFVEFNNGSFSVFNKNGTLVSQVSDTSFWTSALGSNPGGLSDPRLLYDPASQRWFAVMITTDQSTNNKILFARSNTADPTQGFKAISYTTTNGRFADYPTLGLDANGVYVGTNNFNAAGTTLRSLAIYSVPKADLLAPTPTLSRLTTSHNAISTNTYGFTLQPAVNFGPKLATDPEPIISTNNSSFGQYKFVNLTGTTASNATLGPVTSKSVQSTSNPTNSPQPGTSTTLDNDDDRFAANAVQLGNFLYAVHGITVSGRSAVRWTIADATNFNVIQQGTISDPSLSYFYPSIAVNPIGDVVVGFSGSNSSTFASTYAVVGASAGGVPGGSLSFGSPVQTKAGTDLYPDTRWGDYSAVTSDPADPGIFWSHQEYAATRFTNGGTTYGNWATQASEIIPTKPGERRWSNAAGGNFATGANYFTGAAPLATDHVIFSRGSTSYTVSFAGSSSSNRASVRQGSVSWNLGGGSYSLTNSNGATPSVVVGEFQGTAALTVTNGALNSVNAMIAGGAGGSAITTVGADATWTNSNVLTVGGAGPGTLAIQSQGTVYVGSNLAIGALGVLNLNGGTVRFDGYSRAPGGTVNFTSGTVLVAGNRTIDTDTAIKDLFGNSPTIGTGKKLVVEGNASLLAAAPLTLTGGTFAASSLQMASGSQLVSSQTSQVIAPVLAQTGSTIMVSSGQLTIGDGTTASGFYSNGAVQVGASTLTLADADGAVFDSAAQVTLGASGNPGILSSANGLTLNAGGTMMGHGTINTPNNSAAPLVLNGSVSGNSLVEPVTLPGYVKGTGTLDNVDFTGTYSPGASPASVSLGNAIYDGELDIELGGLAAGTEFDQVNHNLGSSVAQLGGTLDVSLINGFTPQAGNMFEILTAAGGISGTFASTMLPALSGDLIWNVNYTANAVDLVVASTTPPPIPGDFNNDGTVDAADYITWRIGLGTTYTDSDYDLWRAHFGETNIASGATAGLSNSAVPEPTSLLMLGSALFAIALRILPKKRGCLGSSQRRAPSPDR